MASTVKGRASPWDKMATTCDEKEENEYEKSFQYFQRAVVLVMLTSSFFFWLPVANRIFEGVGTPSAGLGGMVCTANVYFLLVELRGGKRPGDRR